MFYKAPKINGKPIWVPIVAKNRDFLIGYISGINLIQELLIESLHEQGIEIDLKGIELCLDSTRFNDILENGKRESECTEQEIFNYYKELVQRKINMVKETHPDNGTVFSKCFLEVECECGLGVYSFDTPDSIPEKPLICQICGKTIIDYSEHNDSEYSFDGNIKKRKTEIIENLIDEWVKNKNDEEEDL